MTTPTSKPVPSNDVIDLKFNAEKIDEVVNSDAEKYEDRFGIERFTLQGLRNNLSPLGKAYTLEQASAAINSGEIQDGAHFFIWSDNPNSIADEYINVAGTPTPTGQFLPSNVFIESIEKAQKYINSVISKNDSNALIDHQFALTPLDKFGGLMTIDDDAGVGFAGMPDVIQDRVAVVTDAETRKRFAAFSMAVTEITGRGGFFVFDDNAGLRLADMKDAVQDRLKVISETQIAKILSGAGIQAVTLSDDKTKAFDYL